MAITHEFVIDGYKCFFSVGLFEDGTPGELFINMNMEGSTIGGLMDSVAALTSIALQYGVPLSSLVHKFCHQRFQPAGFTSNPDIGYAHSLIDYIFRWLGHKFIPYYVKQEEKNASDKNETPDKGWGDFTEWDARKNP